MLVFTFALLTMKYLYTNQNNYNHLVKALSSKYPDVGLPSPRGPTILDSNLKAEVVFRGLRYPTSMAFLGHNDILVDEKDTGTVRRIVDGTELQEPLIALNVATNAHRGLLGIAVVPLRSVGPLLNYGNVSSNNNTTAYVFLYYTQAQRNTGDDITEGKQPLSNRLYRYDIDQTEKQHIAPVHPNDLVHFAGKGKYHQPQFTWFRKVVPTGITFLNSSKIGNLYKDDMFVADAKNGNLYHFKLDAQRTGLLLPHGPLADGIVNSSDALDPIVFGKGFGGITDVKVNPYDGYLYVLTFNGMIYSIVPLHNYLNDNNNATHEDNLFLNMAQN
jgi:glucose/arabinose dehydrogenase